MLHARQLQEKLKAGASVPPPLLAADQYSADQLVNTQFALLGCASHVASGFFLDCLAWLLERSCFSFFIVPRRCFLIVPVPLTECADVDQQDVLSRLHHAARDAAQAPRRHHPELPLVRSRESEQRNSLAEGFA